MHSITLHGNQNLLFHYENLKKIGKGLFKNRPKTNKYKKTTKQLQIQQRQNKKKKKKKKKKEKRKKQSKSNIHKYNDVCTMIQKSS